METEVEPAVKFYTAKNDRVFKTIMFDERNEKLLKTFLEEILNVSIFILNIYIPIRINVIFI